MSALSAMQPGFRDPLTVIAAAVVLLFIIVMLLSLTIVIHHGVTEIQRARIQVRFENASVMLAPSLVSLSMNLEEMVDEARLHAGDRTVALVLRKARLDLKGEVARRAGDALDRMGEVNRLLEAAKSRRDWRRQAALRGLGECGGARARKVLIDAAENDKSEEVRCTAREGLLSDATPEAVHAAIESFMGALPGRIASRRSFYTRLTLVADEELTTLIRSDRLAPADVKLALEAMGDTGRRSARSPAFEHLTSPDAEMRATAIRVIGKVGDRQEMFLAIHALNDPEWFVRAAAARTLEWMLTPGAGVADGSARQHACQRLSEHMTDPAWWVRANSARALARAGESGVVLLLKAAEHSNRDARDAAVEALAMVKLLPGSLPTEREFRSWIEDGTLVKPSQPAVRRGGLPA